MDVSGEVGIFADAPGLATAPSKPDESTNTASKSSETAEPQQSTRKRKAPPRTIPWHYGDSTTPVPEDVSKAIALYDPPEKWRCAAVPEWNPKRSIVYEWGVRIEKDPEQLSEETRKSYTGKSGYPQRFICLANNSCRQKSFKSHRYFYSISSLSTSGATTHLGNQHDIMAKKTQKAGKSKTDAKENLEEVGASHLLQDRPVRHLLLAFVKTHIVRGMLPFNFMEDEKRRNFYQLMNKELPVEKLNNQGIKKLVVETYAATTAAFTQSMLEAVRAAPLPIIHINVDIWQSKTCGQKFIGLRIFYLDKDFNLRTHLLAVKLYRPAPELEKSVTGDIVMKWVKQVLRQFHLGNEDIAGAVTDARKDVRSGVGSTFEWEWCIPHLLNRVAADGSGMALTKKQSKNLECRALVEEMKRVHEDFNTSTASKTHLEDSIKESIGAECNTNLHQAVPNRWVSLGRLMANTLQQWDANELLFNSTKNQAFPLAERKTEVEEVYSIVKAVKDVTEHCQSSSVATAPQALSQLVVLMTVVLDPASPLQVFHLPQLGAAKGEDAVTSEEREAAELTPLATTTRRSFHDAIARRVAKLRYGSGAKSPSLRFDMALAVCPSLRSLKHIAEVTNATVGTTGEVTRPAGVIEEVVWAKITSLVEQAIEVQAARDNESATGKGEEKNEGDEADSKRRKVVSAPSPAASSVMNKALAGLLDDDSDEEDDSSPADLTPKKKATAAVKGWRKLKIPKECKGHQDGESACEFWRKHGATLAPHLKPVAQAVLGIPASSAVVERDFCIDGGGFSRENGSLVDTAFAEMLLLLRAAYDDIPDDIPSLTTGEAMAAIPDRLKDAGALEEVDALDSPESPSQNGRDETEEDNDDDDDEEEDIDHFLSTGSFEAAGSLKNGGSIDTGSTRTCVDSACKFASKQGFGAAAGPAESGRIAGEVDELAASRLDRQKLYAELSQEAASAISTAVDGLPPDLARSMVGTFAQSVRDVVAATTVDNSNGVSVSPPPGGGAQAHDRSPAGARNVRDFIRRAV